MAEDDLNANGVPDCAEPILPVVSGQGRRNTTTDTYINGVATTVATVSPGATFTVRFVGSVVDLRWACDACVEQLNVGLEGTTVFCLGSSTGNFSYDKTTTLTAPLQPGLHFISTRSTQNISCRTGQRGIAVGFLKGGWGKDSTLAAILVQ